MIYAIIGHPFAGKSTFVKDVFLKEETERKDGYYICGNKVILGDYRDREEITDPLNRRHVGIDRRHYAKGELFETIKKFSEEGHDVVVEGMQLVRGTTLKSLNESNLEVTLIYVKCDTETILERSKDYSVLKNPLIVDANQKRLENLFNEYKDRMNGMVINSNEMSEEDYKNIIF